MFNRLVKDLFYDTETDSDEEPVVATPVPAPKLRRQPSQTRQTLALKIVVLGGARVGKTSVLRRYAYDSFSGSTSSQDQQPQQHKQQQQQQQRQHSYSQNNKTTQDKAQYDGTVGFDVMSYALNNYTAAAAHSATVTNTGGGRKVILEFWDVAASEQTGHQLDLILSGVDGVVMVCDVTDAKTSMESVDEWRGLLASFRIGERASLPMVLLLNKADTLALDYNVRGDEAVLRRYCKKTGFYDFYHVSAKSGDLVAEALESLIDSIIRQGDSKQDELGQKTRMPLVTTVTHESIQASSREPVFAQSLNDLPIV
jgi:GTPase SAR1 family protein